MGNTVAVSVRVKSSEYYSDPEYEDIEFQDEFFVPWESYPNRTSGLGKNGTVGRALFQHDLRRDRFGQRSFHPDSGDISPSMVRGIDYVRDPRLNKGMAFTFEERSILGIHGMLPPRYKSQDDQMKLCLENINRYTEDLNKHIYLIGLQDRNERLFYRVIAEHVEQMMPLIYTPTVGLACQKFGLIFRRAHGLFISIKDKGHVYEVIRNWPENDVRAVVVTDGERILGLGDLGAYGMGIPSGKLSLYTALAGIKPSRCLPVLLDVGTNNKNLLSDPWYIGLNQTRVTGKEYDEFIDEFMQAIVKRYGYNTLIQFEDFANHNAYPLLDKYKDKYLTFNDDIQGTAAVALAGILASLRITHSKLIDHKILFVGAGGAATGIAELLCEKMMNDGAPKEVAESRIFMSNADGLLSLHSNPDNSSPHNKRFRKDLPQIKKLVEMVDTIKPSILIGASTVGGIFTSEVLKRMGEINERPVIFALSNPTANAECTAEAAYDETQGRAIFASGSPFPDYNKNGLSLKPGQGNNAYIFPGIALAAISAGMHHIKDEVFVLAAQTLADNVCETDLKVGRLYPPLGDTLNTSLKIATKLTEYAYETRQANTYPEPQDKMQFLRSNIYNYHY